MHQCACKLASANYYCYCYGLVNMFTTYIVIIPQLLTAELLVDDA